MTEIGSDKGRRDRERARQGKRKKNIEREGNTERKSYF